MSDCCPTVKTSNLKSLGSVVISTHVDSAPYWDVMKSKFLCNMRDCSFIGKRKRFRLEAFAGGLYGGDAVPNSAAAAANNGGSFAHFAAGNGGLLPGTPTLATNFLQNLAAPLSPSRCADCSCAILMS